MSALILYSERVVLGGHALPVSVGPARLRVEDGKLTEVTPLFRSAFEAFHSVPEPDGPEVVDLGDRLIAPAWVNSHTHLAMTAFRGIGGLGARTGNVVENLFYKLEHALQPGDVRAFARMGAYDALCAGTGSVWDHYYFAEEVGEALLDTGLTGVVAPTFQDKGGPGVSSEEKAWAAVEVLGAGRFGERGVVPALGPHATDTVSDPLWRRVARYAEEHQLPIHMHLSQTLEEHARSRTRHGCEPAVRLYRLGILEAGPRWLMVHGQLVSDTGRKYLKPDQHVLGHCPWSQAQYFFPTPLEPWWSKGFKVALGTDCGACNDTGNVQQELRLVTAGPSYALTGSDPWQRFCVGAVPAAALKTRRNEVREPLLRHLEPASLLKSVWSIPGGMHPRQQVGSIETGSLANLAIYDTEHPAMWPALDPLSTLVMNDCAPALWGLMAGGRWIGERGAVQASLLASDDFAMARSEARSRLRALLERAGISV